VGFSEQCLQGPQDAKVQLWEQRQDSFSDGGGDFSDLGGSGIDSGPYYVDGSTGQCADIADWTYRVAFWAWLKPTLEHHSQLMDGVPRYDVYGLIDLVLMTFEDDKAEHQLDNIVSMTRLALRPGQWPVLRTETIRLGSEMSQVTDTDIRLPPKLLAMFVLRALDSDSDFAVQVASLRASNAKISDIIKVISKRDNELRASRPKPSGHVASTDAGPQAERAIRVCYLFQKGECTYGEACKFEHTPLAGQCLACGSTAHGLDRCPLKKASDKGDKKARGRGDKEMTAMRAQLDALVSQLGPSKDKTKHKDKKTAKDKPVKDKKKAKKAARVSSDEGSDSDHIVGLRARIKPSAFDVYGADNELKSLWSRNR